MASRRLRHLLLPTFAILNSEFDTNEGVTRMELNTFFNTATINTVIIALLLLLIGGFF